MRSAIRNPRVRLLLVAQTTSGFGDKALLLVLSVWMKDLTGSATAAAMVLLCASVALAFGPGLGLVVDRLDRRKLMIGLDVAMPIALLPLFGIHHGVPIGAMFAVAGIYGAASLLISSAQMAVVKSAVPTELLPEVNGLFRSSKSVIDVSAPFIGTGLYALLGPAFVVFIDIASFLVAAGCLALLRIPRFEPSPRRHLLGDLTSGIAHLVRVPELRRLSAAVFVMFALTGVLPATQYELIDHGLRQHASFIGVLATAAGAGGLVGGFLAARLIARLGDYRAAAVSLTAYGAAFLPLQVPATVPVLTGLFLSGAAGSVFVVSFFTALQRRTPDTLMGRVSAATATAVGVPQVLGLLVGSALVGAVGYGAPLLAMTAGLLATGALLLNSATPIAMRAIAGIDAQ